MGDLDRRKHDVDVIERVIGGLQASSDGPPGQVIDVEVTSTDGPSIVELVVNLSEERRSSTDRRRSPPPEGSS
jgi:hypothetical protein